MRQRREMRKKGNEFAQNVEQGLLKSPVLGEAMSLEIIRVVEESNAD